MVDIDDAIASTTTVTPGKLSFGEGSGGSGTLSIANASPSSQTYAVSHVGAVATGPDPGASRRSGSACFGSARRPPRSARRA